MNRDLLGMRKTKQKTTVILTGIALILGWIIANILIR